MMTSETAEAGLPLTYKITEEEDLETLKEILGESWRPATSKESAQFILEHDGAMVTTGDEREAAMKAGAYVAYTRGNRSWKIFEYREEKYHAIGDLEGLRFRLENVALPVTRNSLRDALMEPTVKLKWLPALAILCQGYLAVKASSSEQVCEQALERMGWKTLLLNDDLRNRLPSNLASYSDEVKKKEWWSIVFDMDTDQLKRNLASEWGKGDLPDAVLQLIGNIFDAGEVDSGVVTQAYLAIADKFEGKSCLQS